MSLKTAHGNGAERKYRLHHGHQRPYRVRQPDVRERNRILRDEAMGQTPRILSSGDVPQEKYDQLWQTITSGKTWRDTYKNRKRTARFTRAAPSYPRSGTHPAIERTFSGRSGDLTEKMASEERLKHLARYDELTSLTNRARSMELLAEWIAAVGPENHGHAFFDVDHFAYQRHLRAPPRAMKSSQARPPCSNRLWTSSTRPCF